MICLTLTSQDEFHILQMSSNNELVQLDDEDDDDVLPPPIQEENGNYPVVNDEVSWTRARSWVALRTTCSRLKIRLVLEPKRIELITMALATQGFYKRFKFQFLVEPTCDVSFLVRLSACIMIRTPSYLNLDCVFGLSAFTECK